MKRMSTQSGAVVQSVLDLIMPGSDSLADSEYAGTWRVEDTTGRPFDITLSVLGTAEANRDSEGMDGTWIEDGEAAVITWDTGWTTKIAKTAEGYTKIAYDAAATTPANTSPARKID